MRPRLPDQGGQGSAFALRLDVKNNLVRDHKSLIQRVESAGTIFRAGFLRFQYKLD